MIWFRQQRLRQQRKVDALSIRAMQSGLQARELHRRMGQRLSGQPGALLWVFAAGALAGSGVAQNLVSRTTSIVNRTFELWEYFLPVSGRGNGARNPLGLELKTTFSVTTPSRAEGQSSNITGQAPSPSSARRRRTSR